MCTLMLLEITLAIIFAKIFSTILQKIKQPGVIGEIIAGVFLGPSVLGLLSGSSISMLNTEVFQFELNLTSPEFKQIAFIGIVFLLFIAGLDTNISDLKKTKKAGLSVGFFGTLLPFLFGCFIGSIFQLSLIQCMAIGTIFTATSTTVAIRVLSDMDLLPSRVGLTLRTALVVNDVVAMILFTLVFGIGNSFVLLFQISLFFILAVVIGYFFIRYAARNNTKRHAPIIMISIALGICFFFATFAENMGLTAIIGAFIAGVFIRKTPQANVITDYIKTIGYAFFIPIFFVWVGANFNFVQLFHSNQIMSILLFCSVFVIFAMLGNCIGCSLGARVGGLKRRESISVGVGMMPVMGVALIIVTAGIERGIFGDPTGFLANQIHTATLFLILISCLISPFFFKRSMGIPLHSKAGSVKTKLSTYHHPHCYECFSSLRLNPINNKWYCETCKDYKEVHKKSSPTKKGKLDRNITYVIGAGTILLCVFLIQTTAGMSLFEKISAIIGIILGTMLAFFSLKALFSSQKPFSQQ